MQCNNYTNTKYVLRSFCAIGPRVFNSLPQGLKRSVDVATFKRDLKTYLFKKNEFELEFNPRRSMAISGIH